MKKKKSIWIDGSSLELVKVLENNKKLFNIATPQRRPLFIMTFNTGVLKPINCKFTSRPFVLISSTHWQCNECEPAHATQKRDKTCSPKSAVKEQKKNSEHFSISSPLAYVHWGVVQLLGHWKKVSILNSYIHLT